MSKRKRALAKLVPRRSTTSTKSKSSVRSETTTIGSNPFDENLDVITNTTPTESIAGLHINQTDANSAASLNGHFSFDLSMTPMEGSSMIASKCEEIIKEKSQEEATKWRIIYSRMTLEEIDEFLQLNHESEMAEAKVNSQKTLHTNARVVHKMARTERKDFEKTWQFRWTKMKNLFTKADESRYQMRDGLKMNELFAGSLADREATQVEAAQKRLQETKDKIDYFICNLEKKYV